MSVGGALRAALRDLYQQSWRLFILTGTLFTFVVFVVLAGFTLPLAWALLIAAGPLAAAVMHAAVTVAQTEDLRFADALAGLRNHWRRGILLSVVDAGGIAAGVVAIRFYGRSGPFAWPLSLLALYLLVLFGLLQLALWPLAIFEPERSLSELLREAISALVRRPGAFTVLGAVLGTVNFIAGFAAIRGTLLNPAAALLLLLPVWSLTASYSLLAAAHFSLPPSPERAASLGEAA